MRFGTHHSFLNSKKPTCYKNGCSPFVWDDLRNLYLIEFPHGVHCTSQVLRILLCGPHRQPWDEPICSRAVLPLIALQCPECYKGDAVPHQRPESGPIQQGLTRCASAPVSQLRHASASIPDCLSRNGSPGMPETSDAQSEQPKASSRAPMFILVAILAVLWYLV
ncbi:hypothetical protein DUNSADRAFT_9060 [Dunaliella salina]|uniref:Encoded protein n=1 Tax=Dunaliella salina TaxID=3046 RepID=A0ABQ7GI82_DUNSA|nr:hypothetical protein DUNSADRAFT_9060 [Dunaliella salina]|eukprot:KAF5834317.1 hypothetical protein DUNSADRAFT_9060 [Dunaliella salina]